MKKYIKIVLAIALVLCMCCSLSSCIALDDLKAKHAVEVNDEQIVLQGKTYIKVASEENIELRMDYNYNDYCNVTKENVPVLLSDIQGYVSFVDYKKGIICYNTDYYAREDVYPAVKKAIEERKYSKLFIDYVTYTEDYDVINQTHILTQEEKQAIYGAIVKTMKYSVYTINVYDCNYELSIYRTDENEVLVDYMCDIYSSPNGWEYYIAVENNSDYPDIYVVDKKYNYTIKGLIDMYNGL